MKEHANRLSVGTQAPDIKAADWNGQLFDLEKLKGKKVWLAFFRYASCPLCNLRVSEMIMRFDKLKSSGLEIVAVFQSSQEGIAEYVGKQNPPFPLIGNSDESFYRLYGLENGASALLSPALLVKLAKATAKGFLPGKMEGTLTRIPGDFLVDEQGRIADVYYGKNIGDHIDFKRVEDFLKS